METWFKMNAVPVIVQCFQWCLLFSLFDVQIWCSYCKYLHQCGFGVLEWFLGCCCALSCWMSLCRFLGLLGFWCCFFHLYLLFYILASLHSNCALLDLAGDFAYVFCSCLDQFYGLGACLGFCCEVWGWLVFCGVCILPLLLWGGIKCHCLKAITWVLVWSGCLGWGIYGSVELSALFIAWHCLVGVECLVVSVCVCSIFLFCVSVVFVFAFSLFCVFLLLWWHGWHASCYWLYLIMHLGFYCLDSLDGENSHQSPICPNFPCFRFVSVLVTLYVQWWGYWL